MASQPQQKVDLTEFFQKHGGDDALRSLVIRAFEEDIGSGDVTSNSTVPFDRTATATFLVKATNGGVISGLSVAHRIIDIFYEWEAGRGVTHGERVQLEFTCQDGDRVELRQTIGRLTGNARAILQLERLLLNTMQRMSGIATATNLMVAAVVEPTDAVILARKQRQPGQPVPSVILDTRKTAPGLRLLDKLAVRTGGGNNHRFGLYDMVMIKDNHIAAAGGISKAISNCRDYLQSNGLEHLQIEVECESLEEVQEAIDSGLLRSPTDRIMLDNMVVRLSDTEFNVDRLAQALTVIDGRYQTEASGNITIHSIPIVSATGVDFISSGALTHSVIALDISLNIELHQA